MAGRRADRTDGSTGLFGQGIKTPPTNTGKTSLFCREEVHITHIFTESLQKAPGKGLFWWGGDRKQTSEKVLAPAFDKRPAAAMGTKISGNIFVRRERKRARYLPRSALCQTAKNPLKQRKTAQNGLTSCVGYAKISSAACGGLF